MSSSVLFWYFLISRRATVPGLYLKHAKDEGEDPFKFLLCLKISSPASKACQLCPQRLPVWLLDASGGWGRFARCLRGQLLSWCLPSSTLASGLLSSSHDFLTSQGCLRDFAAFLSDF